MDIKVPTVELATSMFIDNYHVLVRDLKSGRIFFEGGMVDIPAELKEKELYTIKVKSEENGRWVEITFYTE